MDRALDVCSLCGSDRESNECTYHRPSSTEIIYRLRNNPIARLALSPADKLQFLPEVIYVCSRCYGHKLQRDSVKQAARHHRLSYNVDDGSLASSSSTKIIGWVHVKELYSYVSSLGHGVTHDVANRADWNLAPDSGTMEGWRDVTNRILRNTSWNTSWTSRSHDRRTWTTPWRRIFCTAATTHLHGP